MDFPWFFLEFLAKTSIFEFPRPRRSFLPSESSWNLFPTYFVTKTWKISAKMKVSNSSRHLPRVYRVLPTLSNPSRGSSMMSEGSQPVAQTLHACQEKLITECRQKIAHRVSAQNWWLVIDDWWLIIDHGWLMIDNWWLMTDDWWLMIDEWWVMIDDWW